MEDFLSTLAKISLKKDKDIKIKEICEEMDEIANSLIPICGVSSTRARGEHVSGYGWRYFHARLESVINDLSELSEKLNKLTDTEKAT
jgi:hypothetical protein